MLKLEKLVGCKAKVIFLNLLLVIPNNCRELHRCLNKSLESSEIERSP